MKYKYLVEQIRNIEDDKELDILLNRLFITKKCEVINEVIALLREDASNVIEEINMIKTISRITEKIDYEK